MLPLGASVLRGRYLHLGYQGGFQGIPLVPFLSLPNGVREVGRGYFSACTGSASSAVSTFFGLRVLWGGPLTGSAARGNLTVGLVDWSHHLSQVKSIADRWFCGLSNATGARFSGLRGRYRYKSLSCLRCLTGRGEGVVCPVDRVLGGFFLGLDQMARGVAVGGPGGWFWREWFSFVRVFVLFSVGVLLRRSGSTNYRS